MLGLRTQRRLTIGLVLATWIATPSVALRGAAQPTEPLAQEAIAPSEVAASALSEDVVPIDAPEDEQATVAARLRTTVGYLEALQRPTRAYWGTWVAVMSSLTLAQAIPPFFEEDRAARATSIVGASYSAAGLGLVLVSPAPGRYAARRLRAMPEDTHEQRVRKLAEAERLLEGEVASVDRATSWFPHVMAFSLALGAGLGLGLGYEDNTWGALRATFGTLAIVEGRVVTRPRVARRYLARLRGGEPVSFTLLPAAFAEPGMGLRLAGAF